MKFYLDKELAKQNIARCLYKSDKLLSDEDLEKVRKHFNFQGEFLIYEEEDIPYPIQYDEATNTIKQAEIKEDIEPMTLSEETPVIEKIFGEEIKGKKFFYLRKEKAVEKGVSETVFVSDERLTNYKEYYGDDVIQYIGKDCPYFVTYLEDEDTIREATEFEKYQRGQRELSENEVILNKEIITLEDGQYLNDEEQKIITVSCPPEYLVKEWDKANHVWKDFTTDYDRVQAQYREYEGMDTPSTVKEMELQDPALSEEYINMMIELRTMMYSLKSEVKTISEIVLPVPSESLINFKNRFNKFF